MDGLDYEDKEIVIQVLAQSQESCVIAFLAYLCGFTQEETGEILNVSQPRVNVMLDGTKRRLRQNWGL